jgi:hypothetical protein
MNVSIISNPKYLKNNVDEYSGNPLIEALPPAIDDKDFLTILSNITLPPDNISLMPDTEKIEYVSRIQSIIVPTSIYSEMYKNIRRSLLHGYAQRNPLTPKVVEWCYDLITTKSQFENITPSTGDSMTLCGMSGMGKSTLFDRVLNRCFPQIILHPEHPVIVNPQIVWLKFDMPSDASRSGLCMTFFSAIDELLEPIDSIIVETPFAKQYRSSKIEPMQERIKTICATYNIGIIVIDELQNLNVAKSGGEKIILQFFDFISNKVKVPIFKIGTPASIKLFSKEFRTARRSAKSGFIELGPLEETSNDWKFISLALWSYQVISQPQPYTVDIGKTLYKLSGGIIACLGQLIELANIEAIKAGNESITTKILEETYHKHFGLMKDALVALRANDKKQYEDLMLLSDLKQSIVEEQIEKIKKLYQTQKFTGQAAKAFSELIEKTEDEHILNDVDKLYCQTLKAKLDKAILENVKPVVTNNEPVGN